MRKCLLLTILSISILIVQAKTIYYVKVGGNGAGTTWANASSNLQTVIDNSISGDEIWVAQGTYYPTKELTVGSPRTKTFVIKNGVSIFGGFSGSETSLNQRILSDLNQDGKVDSCEFVNETILSGNTDGVNDNWTKTINSDGKTWSWTITGNSNNSYRVITPNAIFNTPTYIDGFTITASNGNITTIRGGGISINKNINVLNCKFSNCFAYEGGAAYGEGGIMRNCEITNCQSDNYGGGIFLNSTSYSNYCTFERNSVNNCVTLNGNGGGLYSATKDSKITNCVFENCCSSTESGGGLYTNSEIKECIINNCSAKKDGGGIYTAGEMINLSRNLIKNCSALSGGGICYTASQGTSSRVFIDNCLILNCSANNFGGGIKQSTGVSRLYIVNCTIVNCNSTYGGGVSSASLLNTAIYNCNAASYGGAAFFGDSYSNDIKNCAFGNNTANGVLSNIYGISTTDFITSDVATTFIQPTSFIGSASTQNQQTEVNSSNWELKLNSACINIGNQQTESYILTGKDLSGNLRLYGNSIDIGAYEFHNTTGLNNITSENIHIQIVDSKLVLTPKHIGDRLSIYDLNGKLILSKTETINLSKKGIYIVQILSSDKTETVKVVL